MSFFSHTETSCKREQNHQGYLNVMPSVAEILRRRQSQQKNSKVMYGDMKASASPLRVGTRLKQG